MRHRVPRQSPKAVARMVRTNPGSRQGGAARLADVFGDPDRNETRVGEGLDPPAGHLPSDSPLYGPAASGSPACQAQASFGVPVRTGAVAARLNGIAPLRGRNLNGPLAPAGSALAGSGRQSGRNRVSPRLPVNASPVMRPLAFWCRHCGNLPTPDGARHGALATSGAVWAASSRAIARADSRRKRFYHRGRPAYPRLQRQSRT
jgi:hypothetical protein